MATTASAPITVFTTSTCPWCVRAKEFLRQVGAPFVERNIEDDRQGQMELYRITGQLGVPVIADNQEAIIGFDPKRLQAMAARHARPKLGLIVANAPDGARVGAVRPDTVGAAAGVQDGDVVVELSGRPVTNADDLAEIAMHLQFGVPTSMQILRNGERQTLILRP
jgi:glutaredoxin 3